MPRDAQDHAVTAASDEAVRASDHAVEGYLMHRADGPADRPGVRRRGPRGEFVAGRGAYYAPAMPYGHPPVYLAHGLVASEDRRFYEHFGIDPIHAGPWSGPSALSARRQSPKRER